MFSLCIFGFASFVQPTFPFHFIYLQFIFSLLTNICLYVIFVFSSIFHSKVYIFKYRHIFTRPLFSSRPIVYICLWMRFFYSRPHPSAKMPSTDAYKTHSELFAVLSGQNK